MPLAAVDIVIVWATIIWWVVAVWRHYKWIAVAQGAVLRVGVHRNRAATVDHGDELVATASVVLAMARRIASFPCNN